MANIFEEMIKNAMAERQKYDRISGNNDKEQNKEQTTPRNSPMSIKLCAEDHECREQKVLKWLKDYVHRHDGRCSKTSVIPEFSKEDDITFENEKVTSCVREIKDDIQRRDGGNFKDYKKV
ncbi:uncharacterized protein LOC118195862 [Stegodyphus dumicola]|uniref:uncharacterized protein LOC118195862 n=1 Tax=Stegodyphus dumicola TaxID=202533 RepID=UPI0015AAF32D|nr:uncharacterized protein LOC118195862 [Stegodyphus dumicola]